jgi:UDP-GlcNAc:undecaprenyl-phosphate GlcNAc-1-phosphate transferase
MALSLPLLDVGLAIGRRFLRAVPIFQGDRGHIHHRVQALGFSTRHTALLLYGVCGLAASLAVLESFSGRALILPILLLFAVLMLAGVRRLKYIEFSAARKILSHRLLRRNVRDQIYLEELDNLLSEARTAEEWWQVVRNTSNKLSFSTALLHLDARTFSENFADDAPNPSCRIYIGFGDRGFLELTRSEACAPPAHMMAVLYRIQSSVDAWPIARTTADSSVTKSTLSKVA